MIVPTLFLFIGLTIVKAEQQYTVEEAATRIENDLTIDSIGWDDEDDSSESSSSVEVDDCKVAIVGAGIGGVYTAWRLSIDTDTFDAEDICIFEKEERLGGRIQHVSVEGYEDHKVDVGAYRFHNNMHKMMWGLHGELGIKRRCYTDPALGTECTDGSGYQSNSRPWVFARGRFFKGSDCGKGFNDDFFMPDTPEGWPYWTQTDADLDGTTSDDATAGPIFWEQCRKPAQPYDTLMQHAPPFPFFGQTWDDANAAADQLIDALRNVHLDAFGSQVPANEISLQDVAHAAGITDEELRMFFETDHSFPERIASQLNYEQMAAIFIRIYAQALSRDDETGAVAFGDMHLPVDDDNRPTGLNLAIRKMMAAFIRAGGRVRFNAKVLDVKGRGNHHATLVLADREVDADHVFLNVAKSAIKKWGDTNVVLAESSPEFIREFDGIGEQGVAKIYCYYPNAWWRWPIFNDGTNYNLYSGRARTDGRNEQVRYHDGAVSCGGNFTRKLASGNYEEGDCRGAMLVHYTHEGDNLSNGARWPAQFFPTSGDMLDGIPVYVVDPRQGNVTPHQQYFFDAVHRELLQQHASIFDELGVDASRIPRPDACAVGSWVEIGPGAAFGKTAHVREHNWMLLKPNERNIYLVNTDFGDVPGWAEGSLRCAERALYHFFDVARPQWLDARYHDPVIRRLNGGSVWVGRDAHLNTP